MFGHPYQSQLNEENETSEVEEKFLSIGEKLGAWGKFAGWGDKLKANAEVSAMSFGVLTLSTAFNAAFLANNIIEMQESLFSRNSGKTVCQKPASKKT